MENTITIPIQLTEKQLKIFNDTCNSIKFLHNTALNLYNQTHHTHHLNFYLTNPEYINKLEEADINALYNELLKINFECKVYEPSRSIIKKYKKGVEEISFDRARYIRDINEYSLTNQKKTDGTCYIQLVEDKFLPIHYLSLKKLGYVKVPEDFEIPEGYIIKSVIVKKDSIDVIFMEDVIVPEKKVEVVKPRPIRPQDNFVFKGFISMDELRKSNLRDMVIEG